LSVILLRAAVTAVILTVPFFVLALSYGKAEGAIWLMFPVILFIPVLILCLLVFAPVEGLAKKIGLDPNVVVPIVGGCIGAVVVVLAIKFSKNPDVVSKFLRGDFNTVAAAIGIILAGAAVAGAWRVSLSVLKSLRWI
jgi:cation transport ATPase